MTPMNKFVPFPLFNDTGELEFSRNICGVIDLLVTITSGKSSPLGPL